MLLITRVHWPSSISLMTDPSGCWMLGKNPRWSIGLQLCANAVSTETRTLVSVFLVCHFMCLLWTHRDTKIQSWMFGPRVKCFHCWPANPLNFSTAGLLHRTPVHFAEGTLRNFCISYVYVYMFMRKCHDLSGYLKFPVTAMMIFGKRIFFIVSWSNLCEVRSNDFLQANSIFCLHFCIGGGSTLSSPGKRRQELILLQWVVHVLCAKFCCWQQRIVDYNLAWWHKAQLESNFLKWA